MKPKEKGIPGQITLFEFLEEMAKATVTSFESAKERILASAEEYLQKGEYLTTLAKERFERVMKNYTYSEIEEKIFSLPSPSSYTFEKELIKGVVRPLLRAIKTFDETDENYVLLKSLVDVEIDIFQPTSMNPLAVWGLRHKDKRTENVIGLTIKEAGWSDKTIYGYKGIAHAHSTYNRYYNDDYSIMCDVGEVLAFLILLRMFHTAMDDESLRPRIMEKWDERNHYSFDLPYSPEDAKNGPPSVSSKDIQEYFLGLKDKLNEPIVVHPLIYKRPKEVVLNYFSDVTDIPRESIGVLDVNIKEMKRRNKVAERDSGYRRTWRHYLPGDELEIALLFHSRFHAWDHGVGYLGYNDLIRYNDKYEPIDDEKYIPPSWGIPYMDSRYRVVWYSALDALWEKAGQAVKTARHYRELKKSSRAKVWMTKKHIPKKVMEEMQKSAFNDYFGYVEFDETVDAEKARIIADEFIAFRESYLNSFDTSKVSLRFRRLGNHKALGLYFPNINCLCVDVSSPSSFIHEYGHCIDFTCGENGALSDRGDFYPVYSRYRRVLLDNLENPENKDIRKQLQGKGKYNIHYYLLNTEAFARCFEIYCTRVLEIKNSICKQEEKMHFAYPEDELLLKLITEYFDVLCASLNKGEATQREDVVESFEAELAA